MHLSMLLFTSLYFSGPLDLYGKEDSPALHQSRSYEEKGQMDGRAARWTQRPRVRLETNGLRQKVLSHTALPNSRSPSGQPPHLPQIATLLVSTSSPPFTAHLKPTLDIRHVFVNTDRK